jgi:hypothetical protein
MQSLDIISILRFVILFELLSGLGVWIYWGCRHRDRYKYSVAPILYVIHALIFIIFTLLNCLPQDVYIIWRDILFVHGLLILNLVGIILIQIKKVE